jgi:uncharacterized protein (TIGR02145 family)
MSLKGKQLFLCFYLLLLLFKNDMMGQVMSNYIRLEGEVLEKKASFNMEEIKVRWKKSALENCSGVPCVTPPTGPPPPPPFTCGTSTVSDIDNNSYPTVLIGTQCWMKENLKVSRYNDGTLIPLDISGGIVGNNTGSGPVTWPVTSGARTVYEHNMDSLPVYGYLYNWYAAKGVAIPLSTDYKNICPDGWHIPTQSEWTTLSNDLGTDAGGKLKSTSTRWISQSAGANNSSGFSALPAGGREQDGEFVEIRNRTYFWSTTPNTTGIPDYAFLLRLRNTNDNAVINDTFMKFGASLRCLKN